MKIYKYDVPNEMILRYCKVIVALEIKYNAHLERTRSEIHNEIFDYVKCSRAGVTKDDRNFMIALNKTVLDLTFED